MKHVFLGMGGLGKLSDAYIENYWQEMVVRTQAKHVYLIHWDDFTQPLIKEGDPVALTSSMHSWRCQFAALADRLRPVRPGLLPVLRLTRIVL